MVTESRVISVLVSGFSGRMGKAVCEAIRADKKFKVVAGVSRGYFEGEKPVCTVYNGFKSIKNIKVDVIIDFSHSDVTEELLDFSLNAKIPVVIGTTGHTQEQLEKIYETANFVPIFYSRNMSVGANILSFLCKEVSRLLRTSCDVEIVEKHHRKKKDAPSGTSLMIAEAISKSWGESRAKLVFDRSERASVRQSGEIGISSVRSGTIVGEHDVIFGLDDETLTLRHTAQSRRIFAIGALLAAEFIREKPAKLYTMEDLFFSEGFFKTVRCS